MGSPAAPATATDHPFGFVIPLADEGPVQLESCLGFLRSAYPDAPVVVVSDGVDHPRYADVCRQHRASYQVGLYLKRLEMGGAWWRRTLEAGVALDTTWIIKLDPDTRVARPFVGEPSYGIAGTLENPGTAQENVQGGCQAIHRSVAETILRSKLTESSALRNEWTFDPDDATRRQWRALAYFSTDSSLMWLARQVGVAPGSWGEIASRWLAPAPDNFDRQFAATHPHKLDPLPVAGSVPLHIVTTCRGRLAHLKETLPHWLAEPNVHVTVVDYGCPDGTLDYLRANHPEVAVVKVTGAKTFHLSRARNIGAAHLPKEADWVCFWDADWKCSPGWADAIRDKLRSGRYLLANPIKWSQFGSVVVRLGDFRKVGGYDEVMTGWGAEDGDFYGRLRTTGVRPASFPGQFFNSIPHGDESRMEHYADKDKKTTQKVSDIYHHRKTRKMIALGRLTTPEENRTMRLEALQESGLAATLPPVEPVEVVVHPAHPGEVGGYDSAEPEPTKPVVAPSSAAGVIVAGARGPMWTHSFHVGDVRFDTAIDLGEIVRMGLAAKTAKGGPVVASEHVAR